MADGDGAVAGEQQRVTSVTGGEGQGRAETEWQVGMTMLGGKASSSILLALLPLLIYIITQSGLAEFTVAAQQQGMHCKRMALCSRC